MQLPNGVLLISYRLRDIPHLRIWSVTLTFQGHKSRIFQLCWKVKIWLYFDILLIRNLYLIPFARYPVSNILVSDLFLLTIQGHQKSNISPFSERSYATYTGVLLIRYPYLIPFARYPASNLSVSGLDLSGSPKVKYFYFLRKLICNFITVFCW